MIIQEIRKYILLSGMFFFCTLSGFAQQSADPDTAYTRVITQRADKIVATLDIPNPAKAAAVRDIIAQQYRDLNGIHTRRDEQVKAAKAQLKDDKAALDARMKAIEDTTNAKLDKLHVEYLSRLSARLTPEQVTKVKDGMTYNVLPLTYHAYLEMLPQLTARQQSQIMDWLVEAREHAMDAGSSEKKHAWFGKYKGRINNYLSAAGIDMKKAEAEWKQRRSSK